MNDKHINDGGPAFLRHRKEHDEPASRCGCGGLCDPGHPCPMAYAAE